MKIAILSPFYPYRGGIAQFSAMLYKELEKEGHTLAAFNFKRLYPGILFPGKTQYVEEGDNAIEIRSKRVLDSINPFSYYRTVKEIKKFEPDVLIISYWMSFFVPAYAHIANRMKGSCKVITLIHNAIPHEPRFFDKPLASLFFKQNDGFIIMSETVKNDLLRLYPEAKYTLKPHPLYDQFGEKKEKHFAREQLGIDKDKKTLLFFGLIRDYKGLDLLIEAFNKLDDSYQLVIAGESYGPFDKYEERIKQSAHRENIHVLNRYIQDSEVPLLFSAADLNILPYRSATQSGVISIAYHFETPMIVTPVGSLPESIVPQGVGLATENVSAEALSTTIQKFFTTNPEYFSANFKREKKNLSWESFTEELVSFIRKTGY